LIVAALAFAGIVVSVMMTLVVPLVPTMHTLLHTSRANAAWVLTITLLASAVFTPVAGRLGDMFGKRRILMIALIALTVGSVLCALSDSLLPVLAGRALQGCAISAIPLGISIMRDVLPPDRVGSAMGLMSSSLGVGGALALPVAALVVQYANWHFLFYGAAAVGALGLLFVLLAVPESPLRTPGRFDFAGAAGLSVALVLLLLGISKGSEWGWTSLLTVGCLALAVIVLIGWGFFELRTTDPLVDLRTTGKRQVLLTNIAAILTGFVMFASQLVPIQLLQLPAATGFGFGLPLALAGLLMMPAGLMMLFSSPIAARVSARYGPKTSLLVGLVILAVSYLAAQALIHQAWGIVVTGALIGLAIGFTFAAMPGLINAAVPRSENASANGINSLMRSIGSSTASAVLGAILAQMTVPFAHTLVPSLAGFRTTYLVAFLGALVAIAVAIFIPGQRRKNLPVSQPHTVSLDVPLNQLDGQIRGHVYDWQGEPINNAVFTLIHAAGTQGSHATSGSDGSYRLTAPYGIHTLICAAPGHQPEAMTVAVSARTLELDLTLVGTGGITGTISSTTGMPTEATVTALDARGEVVATATTANGQYALSHLPNGNYTVTAAAIGHQPAAMDVRIDTAVAHADLSLRTTASLRGRVRRPNGRPYGHATLTLLDNNGKPVATRTTDADGTYRFTDLPDGTYTLATTGHLPAINTIALTANARQVLDLDLAEQSALDLSLPVK
jgi:MFS family permease